MFRTLFAAAAGAAITAIVLTGSPPIDSNVLGLSANAAGASTYRQLNLFGEVFERVRSQYVEPVEDVEVIESAINGMLSSLDPHSSYLSPDSFKDMQVSTRGEFGGLGLEVTMEEGLVKVVSPIDDTPAARAGMKTDDFISHIDGEPIMGLTLNEAIDKMRGPVNTDITVTILRKDTKPFDLTLTRAVVTIQSVRHRTIDNVGYVRIATFSEKTDSGLQKAMANIKRELGSDLSGIVIDLRSNPGGLLDQAVAVTDAFLSRGEIVSTRGRMPKDSQRHNARNGDLADKKPIVILINGGSASASEIVAGALKDHQRATLLGTQSFGKGSVQTVIPLSNGTDGALRLTTAKYYTPSGKSIHEVGIKPDICLTVVVANEDPEVEDDYIDDDSPNAGCEVIAVPQAMIDEARESSDVTVPDYQLDRAVEMIQAMAAGNTQSAALAD